MSKIVVLATDDVIAGKLRRRGEVVTVPDGFTNVRRVIQDLQDVVTSNQRDKTRVTWQKFVEMFSEQYPDFMYVERDFPDLVAAVSARPRLIERLMVEPQLIQYMLVDAGQAADIIAQYEAV